MTQLLQNAVFGTALILAAALLRRALGGRLIPEARLALWFVCLIRLLAPVFPDSGLSLWGLLPRAGTASAPAPAPIGGTGNLPAGNAPVSGLMNPGPVPVEPTGGAFPWEAVALSLWIGVGLLLAVWYVLRWNRTRRAVAEAIPLPRDDPRYAPLPKCARLREGVMDGAPLTFGAARPTVVLCPGLSGAALDCVLAHEGVHARRRDNLWHYAMAAALVLYWWNPAVWLMARLLRRDIELACDRAAVRKLGADRRAEYAETLVALATAGAEPAFCRTFGRKAAEERILSVMKFKKTTVLGVVLSLALVAGVTVAFASGPREVPDEDSTTSSAPADFSYGISSDSESGKVLRYEINIDFLKQCLDQHVAEGTMTQSEADRVLEQARAFSEDDKTLVWSFQGDSGLVKDSFDENGNYRPGFNIFYKDEDGKLTPLDPATVVSGFIFPVEQDGVRVSVDVDVSRNPVIYHGRTYNRADLSAETLEWLDWYQALPEEERLAVSYEPAELRDGDTPAGTDAEQTVPEVVPDYDPSMQDSAGAGDEPAIGELGSSFYDYTIVGTDENGYPVDGQGNSLVFDDSGNLLMKVRSGYAPCIRMDCNISQEHHHEGAEVVYHYNTLPAEPPVCPVEGCTVRGTHTHDGVTYLCNGAHCGGVCDGSCAAAWNGADTAPTAAPVSSGHHDDSHHGNGYHGGHH